ncbi:hypothetical protein N7470_005243 [Penicillium chermesinum]|nr:hypothetical protein N7470_005243 [Penicillium chermesinum]
MADNNELPRLPNTGWRSDDGFTQTPRAGDESTPASASEDPSSSVVAPTPHLGTDTPSSTGPETPVAGHHPPSGGVPARHPGAQTPPAGRDTPVVGHHSSYGGVPARHPGAPTPLAGPNTPVVGRATSFAGPPAHNPGGQAAGYDMSVVGQSPSFSGYPVHNTQVYGPSSTGAQGYSSFMGPAYGHSPSQFEPASHRGAPFNHGQPIPSMRQDQPSYGESVQMHGNMLSQQDVQTHDPYPWEDSPHSNIEDIQAQHRIYRFRSEHAFQRRDVPPPAHRSTSMITDDDEFLSPSAEPRMPILARPRHMSGVTYDPFVHEQPGPPRQGLFTTRPRRELQQPRATTTPRRRVRNNSPTAEEQGPSKRTRRRINEGLSASPTTT